MTPQSFNLTLLCATEATDPKFLSYNGSQLQLEWSAPSGCGFQGETPPPENDKGGDSGGGGNDNRKKSVGSGVGWFFLVSVTSIHPGFTPVYNADPLFTGSCSPSQLILDWEPTTIIQHMAQLARI